MRFDFPVSALLLLLLTLSPDAEAKPPSVRGFDRVDELEKRMRLRHEELTADEEFARKPWHEQLLHRYAEGAESFDGRRLSGSFVVRQIFQWKDLRQDTPPADSLRVAQQLPDALKRRLAASEPLAKSLRCEASRPLVEALTSKYPALRELAVTGLRTLYGTDLFYQSDSPPGARAKAQRAWAKEIRKRRK